MINFTCSNCGEPLEAPGEMAGQVLVCPKCKKTQLIPGACVATKINYAVNRKISQPAIDHWIYGGISLVWLLYTLWNLLRYSSASIKPNVFYEFYLLISAGFAWLGIILSAMLGRLFKMK